jgi:hypothetical protein
MGNTMEPNLPPITEGVGEERKMVGITSVGAYIPQYRLSLEEIGRMWRARGGVPMERRL